jgi:hypothetical protein
VECFYEVLEYLVRSVDALKLSLVADSGDIACKVGGN